MRWVPSGSEILLGDEKVKRAIQRVLNIMLVFTLPPFKVEMQSQKQKTRSSLSRWGHREGGGGERDFDCGAKGSINN